MSLKYLILIATAAMTIALAGGVLAQQTAADRADAAATAQERKDVATDTANQQPAGTAERNKDTLVDEATAADAKYHASRTEANRQARDQAEAAAAAAAGMSHPQDPAGAR